MKKEYVITNEELAQRGLNLNDYALTGDFVYAIIYNGLDICVTRCCTLFDNIGSEQELEQALDLHPEKVESFKKLQRNVIRNLVFTASSDPVDVYIDSIISQEINLGKINGIQKGLHYKNY